MGPFYYLLPVFIAPEATVVARALQLLWVVPRPPTYLPSSVAWVLGETDLGTGTGMAEGQTCLSLGMGWTGGLVQL